MLLINKLQYKLSKLFHKYPQIFTILATISGLYLLLALFQIQILITFIIFFVSIYFMLYYRWKIFRDKGIINMVDPQIRQVLLNRSIFDLYRDQVYYPYITKIISTVIKGAISKPHPNQLNEMFEDFPQHFKKTINTKGLLKLAPQKLQKIVLQKDIDIIQQINPQNQQQKKQIFHDVVPKNYGIIDIKWDKLIQYEAQQQKIHQHTFQKQVLITLNQKIHWKHILPLLSILCISIFTLKKKKFGKILLYQTSIFGIFILILLIIIKYNKPIARKKFIQPKKPILLQQQNK